MSIVKMSKLRIYGMNEDKDDILDELVEFGCAEIKENPFILGTTKKKEEENNTYLFEIEKSERARKVLLNFLEKNEHSKISLPFKAFKEMGEGSEKTVHDISEINKIIDSIEEENSKLVKLKKETIEFVPTNARMLLKRATTKPQNNKASLLTQQIIEKIYKNIISVNEDEYLKEFEKLTFLNDSNKNVTLSIFFQTSEFESLKEELCKLDCLMKSKSRESNEVKFNIKLNEKDQERLESIWSELNEVNQEIIRLNNDLKLYIGELKNISIYIDYQRFCEMKQKLNNNIVVTEKTFALEVFVPSETAKKIKSKIENKCETAIVKAIQIEDNEITPTLTKNNKAVKQAEFVTNMYSVPSYKEVDPNFSVFLFFIIFFGFIMADIGYGIILIVLGTILAKKSAPSSGAKRLWSLIAYGGITAIIWGVLFGSFFGFTNENLSIIPKGIMPDPQNDSITLLLVCLLFGVVQIAYGYFLRGLNALKRGRILDSISNGFMWVAFMIGVVMGAMNYLLNFFDIEMSEGFKNFVQAVEKPGLIILISSLSFAILFAGVEATGAKKLTKSFSAVYGLINLFSDVLSYARLFGLMLSGAIIAQQFNMMALQVMTGFVGYILGALIMLIGHAFNVAMGALGAYIHVVRLQYIEYFGKFYSGEGNLFKPIGNEFLYIQIENKEEI